MSNSRSDFIERLGSAMINIVDYDVFNDIMDYIVIILDDYEITHRCTDLVVSSQYTNEMLLKRYCACLVVDGKSKNTIIQYARELKRFGSFLGKPLTEIVSDDIRLYLAFFRQKGLSNRTLASMRSYIYAFFEWLVNEESIERNPCSKIKPIKYNRDIKKPFTDVEIDALRSACENNRERALIEFLLASGIRRAELCDIEVADIDFNDLSVFVRNGKGGKERVTYINDLSSIYI